MKSLCVEGCRNINHSYSLVNQWQLLKLVNCKFRLFHKDVKPPSEFWNPKRNFGGLNLDQMKIINKIPSPEKNKKYDVVYRINFPLDISETNANRLFVFGTSEYGTTRDFFVGSSLKDACSRDNLNIITPSNWSKIGFLKAGFKENNIKVIPHGVEPSAFYKLDYINRSITRKKLNIKSDEFLLLNVGGLTDNKGVDLLLAAYISLKPKYGNLRLLIKDSSNLYGRRLKDVVDMMIKDERFKHLDFSKLNDVLTISKNLDIEQMNKIYNSSDAYISPYIAEGFNLPPLEAAACGIPIVVSSGGSTDDYFSNKLGLQISSKKVSSKDDESIRIFPEFDSLVSCIETLINSNEYGGNAGSRYVHDLFNWQKITNLLVESFSFTQN
tara:strand:- start:162 stop:1310 length:1149 start_codon:yes stop_codon:yes gene_type:complete